MKKLWLLAICAVIASCTATQQPKETYPYGMSEREWNELSIKDKAAIRRDYYFFEKGNINFVNPTLEVEGKKEPSPNVFMQKKTTAPQAPAKLIAQ